MGIEISNDLGMYVRIAGEFEDSVKQHNTGRLNITEAGSHCEFHLGMLEKLKDRIKDWRRPYYDGLIGVLRMRIFGEWEELDREYIKSRGLVA